MWRDFFLKKYFFSLKKKKKKIPENLLLCKWFCEKSAVSPRDWRDWKYAQRKKKTQT